MIRAIHFFCAIAAFFLTACGNKPSSEGTAEKSAWLMSNYPVARVDVSTPTGTLLESFEYTYDDLGRMASLTRKDCQRNRVLLKDVVRWEGRRGSLSVETLDGGSYELEYATGRLVGRHGKAAEGK